jgi:hypothetical protein
MWRAISTRAQPGSVGRDPRVRALGARQRLRKIAAMKIRKDDHGPRDQGLSVFSGILRRFCAASGALGAALVDSEGETVDYAGRVDPFDLRVAAAEFRLVLRLLESGPEGRPRTWPLANEVLVRASGRSFAFSVFSDGYALVLVLPRHAFRLSRRALAQTADELEGEAGLTRLGAGRERLRWTHVDVRTQEADRRRPEAVWHDEEWRLVTILGRMPARDLENLELGYLARFANGRETLLVREPLGKWFAGDPL